MEKLTSDPAFTTNAGNGKYWGSPLEVAAPGRPRTKRGAAEQQEGRQDVIEHPALWRRRAPAIQAKTLEPHFTTTTAAA